MIKVAAIILNYNSHSDTIHCTSLLKKQQGIDLDIIVVDNCSSDGNTELLKNHCDENDLIFIENDKNSGFSAGNNIGLKDAMKRDCTYAMVINPDVEIRDSDYIKQAVLEMKRREDVAVLGTNVVNMKGQHQNPMREVRFFEEVFWPYVVIRNRLKKSLPYVKNYKKSGYCEKVSGCCFFVKMSFIKEIGYLDENVFLYSEEPILAATVKTYGYKIFYKHNIIAHHMHKELTKTNSEASLQHFFQSRKYYLKQYSGYGKIRLAIIELSLSWQEKMILKKNRHK